MAHADASRQPGGDRDFIELAPWPIHRLDARGEPHRANPALVEFLGYSSDEFDRSTLAESIPSKTRRRLADCLNRDDRRYVELSLVYRHRNDTEIQARQARVGPLDDTDSPTLVMLADLVPAHQLRRVDIQSRFARLIAHDLNNVFTIAQSYVDLARRQSPEGRMAADYLERAARAVRRGIHTSRQLQTLALDKGFPIEPSNLEESIAAIQPFLSRLLPTGPRWSFECSPNLPEVMSHPALLNRFVLDFAVNAHRRWPHVHHLEIDVRPSPTDQPAIILRIRPTADDVPAPLSVPFRLYLCRPDPFSPARIDPLFVSDIVEQSPISVDADDENLTALIPAVDHTDQSTPSPRSTT